MLHARYMKQLLKWGRHANIWLLYCWTYNCWSNKHVERNNLKDTKHTLTKSFYEKVCWFSWFISKEGLEWECRQRCAVPLCCLVMGGVKSSWTPLSGDEHSELSKLMVSKTDGCSVELDSEVSTDSNLEFVSTKVSMFIFLLDPSLFWGMSPPNPLSAWEGFSGASKTGCMKSSEVASGEMSSKIISGALLLEMVPSLIVRLCTLTLESLRLTIFSMAIL